MTEDFPYLTDEFGLMPWHLGGPAELSYPELRAYIKYYTDKRQAEAKQARSQNAKSRRR